MKTRPTLAKAALGMATVTALAVALIGVAHTPWGRPLLQLPLLSALARGAGCPVGSIEPAAFETVRRHKLGGEVGAATAKSHPALGFTLGQTRRSDVERWAKQERASCQAGLVASVLECEDVTSSNAPPIAHLRLQFDGEQRLVSVDLFRAGGDDHALVTRFQTLGRELEQRVGPATARLGTPTLSFMKASSLRTAVQTFGYRDYVAKSMLLNLGKRGLRLREQYQWLQPPDPA
jgi:hypothetical protein